MHKQSGNPILIAGAGPVGLAAAIDLTLKEYPVRIIESRSEPSTYSKAIGINARTLELLEPSGVTKRLLEQGLRIPRINFQNPDRPLFSIDFSKASHRYNFMLGLPQSETERILEARLNELGVKVERDVQLERFDQCGDSVTAYLTVCNSIEACAASYIIGADGAHSTVRKRLGIDFSGNRMPGKWSLADVRMDTPLPPDAANVIFGDDGILFAIGFSEGVYRIASNRPNVIGRLPEGTVVHEILWKSDFAVSHRLAERYSVGRVFLAGDAAHIHSPLGARGMNLGIEDTAVLVNAIVTGRLEEYSRQRSKVSRAVVRMVKAQTRLATSRNPIADLVRTHIAHRALASNAVQRRLAERMLGLGYQQIKVNTTMRLSKTNLSHR